MGNYREVVQAIKCARKGRELKPVTIENIKSVEELEIVLREYAEVAARYDALQTKAVQTALEAVAKFDDELGLLSVKSNALYDVVSEYCEKNKGELLQDGKKSKALRNGVIGWKASTALSVESEQMLVRTLEDAGQHDCLIYKAKPDKAAIKKYYEQLPAVVRQCCSVEKKDEFYIKTNNPK